MSSNNEGQCVYSHDHTRSVIVWNSNCEKFSSVHSSSLVLTTHGQQSNSNQYQVALAYTLESDLAIQAISLVLIGLGMPRAILSLIAALMN